MSECTVVDNDLGLYAIADPMGGDGGSRAATTTLETLVEYLRAGTSGAGEPELAVRDAIVEANRRVIETVPRGAGCAVAVVWFCGERAVVAHVGDSLVFRWRDAELVCLTAEHSLRNDYIAKGFTTEQIATVPANIIVRTIGMGPEVRPDVQVLDVRSGDAWLLASDGVVASVGEPAIAEAVAWRKPPDAVREILRLAEEKNGPDNLTCVVARRW